MTTQNMQWLLTAEGKLMIGRRYVLDVDSIPVGLEFAGWDGSNGDGYNVAYYFDTIGRYLGADQHGVEPTFRHAS